MAEMIRLWLLACLATLGALSAVVLGQAGGTLAQTSKAIEWDRFDVTLELQDDGSYRVTERQVIEFKGGPFRAGFAEIPLTNVEAIGGFQVAEEVDGQIVPYDYVPPDDYEDEPGTFTNETTSTDVLLDYAFEPTTNQTRTFIVEYAVLGGLRVYPEEPPDPAFQQIRWRVIDTAVTDTAPVNEATYTVVLPRALTADELALTTLNGDVTDPAEDFTQDRQTFAFATEGGLDAGDSLEIWLQFPAIVDVAAPSWQQNEDERAAREDEQAERSALLNLMFLGGGLLFAIVGGLAVYGLWYGRGRDPHEGLVADFIPEPPDDLPAGVAGALLDERVDEQDVVATMLDLAHRGAIKLEEVQGEGILGIGAGRDYKLTLIKAELATRALERDLLSALFTDLKDGAETKLSAVRGRFDAHRDELAADIYAELVARKYFTRSPEETRRAWQSGGKATLAVAIVAGLVLLVIFVGEAWLVVLPVLVAVGLAFALYRLSGAMPRKTREGVEAAAKWRAFRRYLDDIEKYEAVDEAKATFDKYLPYAVAFGLERSWVAKFASVRAPAPRWYESQPGGFGDVFLPQSGWDPYPRRRRGGTVVIGPGSWGGGGWAGGPGGGDRGGGIDVDMPDLQDVSDRAGRSLQGASGGLFQMLNVAAEIFGSMSSGGGGSSGGGFRGSSFRGGGGGRRSGGGGKRGFR
jgi:hypothetical protein